MVAVAHGEDQGRHAGYAVLLPHGVVAGQIGQGAGQGLHLVLGELPASQMAALHHQLKVVDLLHGAGGRPNGLNAGLLGVVDQEHHVGQLDRRVLADPDPGGDALQDRALGGPDEGAGAGGVVVLLQVHRRHQAGAHLAVRLGALNVNDGIGVGLEDVPGQIVVHGAVDVGNVLVHVGIVELALGQDQAQGAGRVAGNAVHLLPVLGLGCELVAGHHGPAGHVAVLGQQDVRGLHAHALKLLVHCTLLHLPFLVIACSNKYLQPDRQALPIEAV